MGRVSRYKKISKDDPFAPRRAKEVDETIDYAPEPTKEVDDAGGMTRTAKAVMKAQERMRRDQERTYKRNSLLRNCDFGIWNSVRISELIFASQSSPFSELTRFLNVIEKRFDALSEKAKQRAVNKPSFDFVSVAQKSASLEHAEGQYKPNMQPKVRKHDTT